MENEVWKDVVGYEGIYKISSKGRLKSLDMITRGKNKSIRKVKGKILKPSISKGYECTMLQNKGKKSIRIHRLVALAFLDNPTNKKCVNHINGIRDDNRVANLEWCSHRENTVHSEKTKGKFTSKYRGVSWDKYNKKWKAHIRLNKKQIHIGYFKTEESAKQAHIDFTLKNKIENKYQKNHLQ